MRTGSRWLRLAIASMRGGIVAEKSTVCRVRRRFLEHRLDVLGESHVEHLVGFVEHDDLHAAHREASAPQVVERAARCCDDDVHAGAHRMQLPADRLAAVDRQHAHAERLAVAVDGLGDLHRELARGHEHDGDRPLRCGPRS